MCSNTISLSIQIGDKKLTNFEKPTQYCWSIKRMQTKIGAWNNFELYLNLPKKKMHMIILKFENWLNMVFQIINGKKPQQNKHKNSEIMPSTVEPYKAYFSYYLTNYIWY